MQSREYKEYLRKQKKIKWLIRLIQLILLFLIVFIWEYLSKHGYINAFIYSRPSMIFNTIVELYRRGNLFKHIWITLYETVISFGLATILGIIMAIILWWSSFLYRVVEPYLTLINSLPKVALGPIIIIIIGANVKSIIVLSLLISLIITIMNVYTGFQNTDYNELKLMKSFGANKWQILSYLVIPCNYSVMVSALKINVSMSLVGVIMGEFLVSKGGIGYLINYGSQVFNLNLVFSGIMVLMMLSYLMYIVVLYIEKVLIKS